MDNQRRFGWQSTREVVSGNWIVLRKLGYCFEHEALKIVHLLSFRKALPFKKFFNREWFYLLNPPILIFFFRKGPRKWVASFTLSLIPYWQEA